jgi:hypothetical protein
MEVLFPILGSLVSITLFWVLPIWLGLRAARRNKRSGLWMWFGVHPLGGWITFAVLASLPPLKVCSQCGEKAKAHARICPFCLTSFDDLAALPVPAEAMPGAIYPQREISLRAPLLAARIVVSVFCFLMVLMYALVYSTAVLQGHFSGFATGFAKVPFSQPPIVVLLVISLFTFVGVLAYRHWFYTRAKVKPSSFIPLNLAFTILASAFMETIAIYGLVLGFMFGPDISTLTLAMLLATMLGGILIFPREQQWSTLLENSQSGSAKQP